MPSPIAVSDLIATAMRKLGVLAGGEVPTADEANVGFQALNDVLETWSIDGMALTQGLPATFATIAGTSTYSIGAGGAWNGQRPAMVSSAYSTLANVDYPIGMWTLDEYMNETLKQIQAPIVERMVYVNSAPLGQVILWPVPSQVVNITLNYENELAQVASLGTVLTLAPAYIRALQYAVAQELQSEFGGQDMSGYARASLAAIKRANRGSAVLQFDPALVGGGTFVGVRGY